MVKHCSRFLKLLVDRVRVFVLWVVCVTVRAGGNVATRLRIKSNRKNKKVMNGKTVAAAVVITMAILVLNKKLGGKLPAAVRNWLP